MIFVFDTKLLRLIHFIKMRPQKEIGEPYLKLLDAWSLKTTCLKVYGLTSLMTTAVIRSRYFNYRVKETLYYMITGRKPDLSKMNIFESTCYAYKNLKKKLYPKCEKGKFVWYDRNSASYLVFYPENNRVLKHKLIKFISNVGNQQTQTYPIDDDDDDDDEQYFPQKKYVQNNTSATTPDQQIKTTETQDNAQTEEDSKL